LDRAAGKEVGMSDAESFKRYEKYWQSKPLYWRFGMRAWWYIDNIWSAFTGNPGPGERMIANFLKERSLLEYNEKVKTKMIIRQTLKIENKLNIGDISVLVSDLKSASDADYKSGDVWQSVLNLAYDNYNAILDRANLSEDYFDYGKMVDYFRSKYGAFAAACLLLGKYNQQVTNGGHCQYIDNGYDVRHKLMLRTISETGLNKLPKIDTVYGIARAFNSWNEVESDDAYQTVFENGWESYFGEIVYNIVNHYDSDIIFSEHDLKGNLT